MTSKLKLILFYSKIVVIIPLCKAQPVQEIPCTCTVHARIESRAAWNFRIRHDIIRACSTSYHLFWWSFVLQSFKLHEKCITILVIQASSTVRDSLNRVLYWTANILNMDVNKDNITIVM